MNRIFHRLLFISFLCGLFNCSENENPVNHQLSNSPFPLKVNNSWNWRPSILDSSGTELDSFYYTMIIKKETVINGHTWFVMSASDDSSESILYTNKSDGVWAQSFNVIECVYKYPVQMGETYNISYQDDSTTIITTIKVISTDTLVSVASGSYSCILYQGSYNIQNEMYYYDTYFCPGIGVIKAVHKAGNISLVTKLVSFVIN